MPYNGSHLNMQLVHIIYSIPCKFVKKTASGIYIPEAGFREGMYEHNLKVIPRRRYELTIGTKAIIDLLSLLQYDG